MISIMLSELISHFLLVLSKVAIEEMPVAYYS